MKTSQKAHKTNLLKELKESFEGQSNWGTDNLNVSSNRWPNFDSQLFGDENYLVPETPWQQTRPERQEPKRIRRTEVVFNYLERQTQAQLNHELKQLTEVVKKELDSVKTQTSGLVSDVSRITVEELPQQAGIYHLRFLEFIVKLLRSIRTRISEGRLWLQTTFEKKNKKKFWKLAKSKGTKFSLSKELTQANQPG